MKLAFLRRFVVCAAWAAVIALTSSCGAGADETRVDDATIAPPRWTATADAASYRVRGWSGSVLLFEVNTIADSLPWTPSLRRAADAFDTVTVRIQPLDGADRPSGGVQEIRIRPRAD